MKNRMPDKSLEYLYRGFLTLESLEDVHAFLQDLCTESELQEMSRRLQAAKMLKNNYIYAEIAAQTGLSTATISRVNRCLKYGSEGYISVLDRLDRAEHR